MSLINYVEAADPAAIFVGLGELVLAAVLAFIFYRLYIKVVQYFDVKINKEIKYSIIEEDCLQKIASKRNIDLDKELRKRNMLKKPSKNFRKKIEDSVFNEMFPEKKA